MMMMKREVISANNYFRALLLLFVCVGVWAGYNPPAEFNSKLMSQREGPFSPFFKSNKRPLDKEDVVVVDAKRRHVGSSALPVQQFFNSHTNQDIADSQSSIFHPQSAIHAHNFEQPMGDPVETLDANLLSLPLQNYDRISKRPFSEDYSSSYMATTEQTGENNYLSPSSEKRSPNYVRKGALSLPLNASVLPSTPSPVSSRILSYQSTFTAEMSPTAMRIQQGERDDHDEPDEPLVHQTVNVVSDINTTPNLVWNIFLKVTLVVILVAGVSTFAAVTRLLLIAEEFKHDRRVVDCSLMNAVAPSPPPESLINAYYLFPIVLVTGAAAGALVAIALTDRRTHPPSPPVHLGAVPPKGQRAVSTACIATAGDRGNEVGNGKGCGGGGREVDEGDDVDDDADAGGEGEHKEEEEKGEEEEDGRLRQQQQQHQQQNDPSHGEQHMRALHPFKKTTIWNWISNGQPARSPAPPDSVDPEKKTSKFKPSMFFFIILFSVVGIFLVQPTDGQICVTSSEENVLKWVRTLPPPPSADMRFEIVILTPILSDRFRFSIFDYVNLRLRCDGRLVVVESVSTFSGRNPLEKYEKVRDRIRDPNTMIALVNGTCTSFRNSMRGRWDEELEHKCEVRGEEGRGVAFRAFVQQHLTPRLVGSPTKGRVIDVMPSLIAEDYSSDLFGDVWVRLKEQRDWGDDLQGDVRTSPSHACESTDMSEECRWGGTAVGDEDFTAIANKGEVEDEGEDEDESGVSGSE